VIDIKDFVKNEKPGFSITTLCPPMIYGPPIHSLTSLNELNESNSQLWKIISSGKDAEVPETPIPLYTGVRDVAMAHVLAMESPKAANQRYAVMGAQYSNQEVFNCSILTNPRLLTLSVTSFLREISFL
jgi:nucleoside-diphosphate-sugar epimerase